MTENAYARSGVNVDAGDRAVELMKADVQATQGPEVLSAKKTGGFAGLYDFKYLAEGMRHPLLATSTDGVGTKVDLARRLGIFDTLGYDLVGMVVDDLATSGIKPLFMTDYIACGHVEPERIAAIVRGVAKACAEVGCALVGGETAEHPGLLGEDEFDMAGAATGVVDAPRLLGPARVCAGDMIVGFASSGLHSNGYSLVRKIVSDQGLDWDMPLPDFIKPSAGSPFADRVGSTSVNDSASGSTSATGSTSANPAASAYTLGLACLEPTRLYSRLCLDLENQGGEAAWYAGDFSEELDGNRVHAFAHVTGGGLAANLARVIPAGLHAVVDRSAWPVPALFKFLMDRGNIDQTSAEDTWNLGIGMVAIVHPDFVRVAEEAAANAGIGATVIGRVGDSAPASAEAAPETRTISGTKGVEGGTVTLHGTYRF